MAAAGHTVNLPVPQIPADAVWFHHWSRRLARKSHSLHLQGPQLDLVMKREKCQQALGLDQPQDIEIAPHVSPLGNQNAVQ